MGYVAFLNRKLLHAPSTPVHCVTVCLRMTLSESAHAERTSTWLIFFLRARTLTQP